MQYSRMDYFELLTNIHFKGEEIETRGLKTKELRNVILTVNHYNAISHDSERPWDDIRKYLFAEMAWYLTGDRTLTNIRPYSKFWDKIVNPDGVTINSNYGDLVFYRKNIHGITSFEWAKQQLLDDPSTRKAIVLYNDRDFFFTENKDLICNQYQQFMIRNNKLDCSVCLRSSDAIFGLTYNIPWWSLVHQQMFLSIKKRLGFKNLQLGAITAFISSSHIYENKFEMVKNIVEKEEEQTYHFLELKHVIPIPTNSSPEYFETYQKIIEFEFGYLNA